MRKPIVAALAAFSLLAATQTADAALPKPQNRCGSFFEEKSALYRNTRKPVFLVALACREPRAVKR
jgi:hypothetical protein